jgi:signal transduction histidine kinase
MTVSEADDAAVQRLVTDGAHEVRSQLAVILLELGRIEHPGARALERDVQAASDTINRIATLFRLMADPPLAKQPVDIDALVRDIVQRAQQEPPRAAVIDVVAASEACPSHAHRAFIAEAVRGLLDNAIRHTPSGTRIVVTVARSGEGAVVRIDDNGPGLAAAVADRFGQPFVHNRGESAGVGLGLALSRQIARLHGGDLRQSRSPLGGACVTLSLGTDPPDPQPPSSRLET